MGVNEQAINALFVVQISAATSCIVTCALSAWHSPEGAVSGEDVLVGILGGLSAGTAGSGYLPPLYGVLTGAVSAPLVFYTIRAFRTRWFIDDVLDCFALQAVSGVVGALLTGLGTDPDYFGMHVKRKASTEGWFISGSPLLLVKQAAVVAVVGLWTLVWTYAIFRLLRLLFGDRLTSDDNCVDAEDHGHGAYVDMDQIGLGKSPLLEEDDDDDDDDNDDEYSLLINTR